MVTFIYIFYTLKASLNICPTLNFKTQQLMRIKREAQQPIPKQFIKKEFEDTQRQIFQQEQEDYLQQENYQQNHDGNQVNNRDQDNEQALLERMVSHQYFTKTAKKPRRPKNNQQKHQHVTLQILDKISQLFTKLQQESSNEFIKKGISLKKIGERIGLSMATVYNLYSQFLTDPLFTKRRLLLSKVMHNYRNNGKTKMSRIRTEFISAMLKANPLLLIKEIVIEMNKHPQFKFQSKSTGEDLEVSPEAVRRILKQQNYTKKRIRLRPPSANSPQNIEQRYNYAVKYRKISSNNYKNVYFVHQTTFNLFLKRDKGWSRKGEPVDLKPDPSAQSGNISLLIVLGYNGIIKYWMIEGIYSKSLFSAHIKQFFKTLGTTTQDFRYLIMDNPQIQGNKNLIQLGLDHKVRIIFMPTYSQRMNPIQCFLNQFNCKLRQKQFSDNGQLAVLIRQQLQNCEGQKFWNFYKQIQLYISLALDKEQFP